MDSDLDSGFSLTVLEYSTTIYYSELPIPSFNSNFNRACEDKKAHRSQFNFSTKTPFFEKMVQFL